MYRLVCEPKTCILRERSNKIRTLSETALTVKEDFLSGAIQSLYYWPRSRKCLQSSVRQVSVLQIAE